MDFDEVADELYSLPVEEFIATRNARAKQAKADGDGRLAASIKSLSKPNAVAALTNQLVRQSPAEIQPLIELGEDLRAATAAGSGPRLRELSRLQRSLVSELVEEARQLAVEAGRSITADVARGVADTLRAALADPAAAAELLAARLTQGLFRSGLESGADGSAGDRDDDDAGADQAGVDNAAAERRTAKAAETAEDERQHAQQLLDSATGIRDHAAAAALQADREATDAAEEAERLCAQLDQATARLGHLRRDAAKAAADLDKAERLVRAAQRQLDRH